MGVSYWNWWRDFFFHLWHAAVPGAGLLWKALPVVLAIALFFWVPTFATWVIPLQFGWMIGAFNEVRVWTVLVVSLWIFGAIGYAVARARSSRLSFGNLMLDDFHGAMRASIRYVGPATEPEVYVIGLANETGEQLALHLNPSVGLPLQWAHRRHDERVRLGEGLSEAEVTVFFRIDSYMYLYREPAHHLLLFSCDVPGAPQRVRVRLRAVAPNCDAVEWDYWIDRNGAYQTGYVPSLVPPPAMPVGT